MSNLVQQEVEYPEKILTRDEILELTRDLAATFLDGRFHRLDSMRVTECELIGDHWEIVLSLNPTIGGTVRMEIAPTGFLLSWDVTSFPKQGGWEPLPLPIGEVAANAGTILSLTNGEKLGPLTIAEIISSLKGESKLLAALIAMDYCRIFSSQIDRLSVTNMWETNDNWTICISSPTDWCNFHATIVLHREDMSLVHYSLD